MKKLFLSLMLLNFVACSTTPTTPPQNTEHWATAISAEHNLYRLDDKFYRSEQLTKQDYALLQKLGVKTIVNLRFFDGTGDHEAFGKTDLTLHHTPLLTWAITPKDVAKVLAIIHQHQQQGAVLVHCYHGADRTGLISAMYRIVYQNWSLDEAKREMIQGPYGYHSIWKNLENFFTEKNVAEIKAELARLSPEKGN